MSRKTRQNTEVDLEDLEKILPYISDTYSAILRWISESKQLRENIEISLKPVHRKKFSISELDPFNLEGKLCLKRFFKTVEISKIKIGIPHKKHTTFTPVLTLKISRNEYKRYSELLEEIIRLFEKITRGTAQVNFGD